MGHGITIAAPISKKSHSQVGILFVDDTHLWEGLGKDDDIASTLKKCQQGLNSWGRILLAVGRELIPDKCSHTVHRMEPTNNGTWEYVKENSARRTQLGKEPDFGGRRAKTG